MAATSIGSINLPVTILGTNGGPFQAVTLTIGNNRNSYLAGPRQALSESDNDCHFFLDSADFIL